MGPINGINANKPMQPVKPVEAVKKREEEEKRQQAMEQTPMFAAPVYMYPVQNLFANPIYMNNNLSQPIYMAPPQPMFIPTPVAPIKVAPNNVVTNPIKEDTNKVSVSEAMRAQALQPKVEVKAQAKVEEKAKADEKAAMKPEDVVLKAEQQSFKGETNEVKQQEKQAEVKVQNKKPEIVESEKLAPQLDMEALVELLASSDYEQQANAMEAVAQVAKLAPDRSDELLDVKVVDTLIGVMTQDTSKVPEADRALAQRNKEYAMYTTALLQKVYQDGVKKVAKEDVPMEDVVGMAAIVNNLKTDENASTRKAALEALSYTKRPVDNELMNHLFAEAANDIDPSVRARAEQELQQA